MCGLPVGLTPESSIFLPNISLIISDFIFGFLLFIGQSAADSSNKVFMHLSKLIRRNFLKCFRMHLESLLVPSQKVKSGESAYARESHVSLTELEDIGEIHDRLIKTHTLTLVYGNSPS